MDNGHSLQKKRLFRISHTKLELYACLLFSLLPVRFGVACKASSLLKRRLICLLQSAFSNDIRLSVYVVTCGHFRIRDDRNRLFSVRCLSSFVV